MSCFWCLDINKAIIFVNKQWVGYLNEIKKEENEPHNVFIDLRWWVELPPTDFYFSNANLKKPYVTFVSRPLKLIMILLQKH